MLFEVNTNKLQIKNGHSPIKLSSLSSTMGLLLKVRYFRVLPTRLKLSGTVRNLFPDRSICLKFKRPLNVSNGIVSISVFDRSNTCEMLCDYIIFFFNYPNTRLRLKTNNFIYFNLYL